MGKVVLMNEEAREGIFSGIKKVAECVGVTMGAYGSNVVVDYLRTEPDITNDGNTIIREIDFEDRLENIGALMVKKASDRTNKIAGDGTTTTAILSYAIIQEGLPFMRETINPFSFTKSMNKLSAGVIEYIKSKAQQIKSKDDIKRIATISSQDAEIGAMIADAYEKVGDGGTVVAAESQTLGLSIEMKNGIEYDEPINSIYLINNAQRMQCEIDKPYLFVSDKKLGSLSSIKNVIDEMLSKGKKDIFFIVDGVDPLVLSALIANAQKGLLNVGLTIAPSYAEKKEQFFQDICALTGATLISTKTGIGFEDVMLEHLGVAEKVISGRQSTIVVGGNRDEEKIKEISDSLKIEISKTLDEYKKSELEKRLAKLTGGIATIRVGYPSNTETTQKRLKIDDAILAVKSALQEGVIYGEGVSLIEGIMKTEIDVTVPEDIIAGKILEKALCYPTKLIVDNGGQSGDWAVTEIKRIIDLGGLNGAGFDFISGEIRPLLELGVIDPVKVVRVALENAVSLANMVLTSKAVLTENPEKKIDGQDVEIK